MTFSAIPENINQLVGADYNAMHLMAAQWSMLGHRLDDQVLRDLLGRSTQANAALLGRSADRKGIVVQHRRFLDRDWTNAWMRQPSGFDLRHHEDQRYGAWVAETYDAVLAGHRPRLERVWATIQCPEFGRCDFDYDRLILPWVTPTGDVVATLTSVVRAVRAT